jgi:predicted ATP-grasp superfamily ATP-dependent carboligase
MVGVRSAGIVWSVAREWVLITDGGDGQARSSLAAVRALAEGGYRPAVTVSGPPSLAAASRYCDRRVVVPHVTEPGYAEAVRAELAAWPYHTVLAASDVALLALGYPVEHLVNKAELTDRARQAGLSVPPTRAFSSPSELLAAGDIEFPAVVKPAISTYPARVVRSGAELEAVIQGGGPFVVQAYQGEHLRALAGVVWEDQLAAASHQRYLRTWPAECGTACAAQTAPPDLELEERVLRLLVGYQGIFQVQLAGDQLLDVNPRVYGSLPLAVAAGANLPAVYCDLLSGKKVHPVRARPGVFYRWLEGDLRHVVWAVRNGRMGLFSALGMLRPHPKAAHSTESLRDPMPMVARLRFAATRYLR